MDSDPYKRLAERLDTLPNGFPPTDDGAELGLLAKIFTPEQADLAASLKVSLETPEKIAERIGAEAGQLSRELRVMARKGLIRAGRTEAGLGYGLMPFVIGIYEMQLTRIDAEMARLFEDYYQKAFHEVMKIEPQVHRILPVGESITLGVEVQPYESVREILAQWNAWGVQDCICRKQKALLGEPCGHPLEICMVMSRKPGAFDESASVRALTLEEAQGKLREAEEAGLVHTVGNNREEVFYVCNCCTCSCAILRGMKEMGIANVVARSAFVNTVDEERCTACSLCEDYCEFDALSVSDVAEVDEKRCMGCGICVMNCPDGALALVRRPEDEILDIPVNEFDWGMKRALNRGIDLAKIL